MTSLLKNLRWQTSEFFFRPASPRPLSAVRIGLSFILIVQGFFIAPVLLELYGRQGYMQGELIDYLMAPFGHALPSLNWLSEHLFGFFISPDLWLTSAFHVYMTALVFLLFGYFTRTAAVFAVLTHWLLMGAGFWSSYGADRFAQIALFYFIWMPVGALWSFDEKSQAAPSERDPWPLARVSLRIFQIHLCLVYLSTAIAKARGHQWWDGEAIWYAVMSYGTPVWQTLGHSIAQSAPWIFKVL
jgi:hypothetical protein